MHLCQVHVWSYLHALCSTTFSPCSCATGGHGTADISGIIVGMVVVSVLLTLLGLTAGVIIGVVLGRRIQEGKGKLYQRQGESQERSGTTNEVGGATETDDAEHHISEDVDDATFTNGRVVLYQGLDVGTQDYVSVYTQLRGGTYQELDPRGREEEHHYLRASMREGHGRSVMYCSNK